MIDTIFYFVSDLPFESYLNRLNKPEVDDSISNRTIVFADEQKSIYKGGVNYSTVDTSIVKQVIEDTLTEWANMDPCDCDCEDCPCNNPLAKLIKKYLANIDFSSGDLYDKLREIIESYIEEHSSELVGSNVTVTPKTDTGSEIAVITVNGTSYSIKNGVDSSSGGSGGSSGSGEDGKDGGHYEFRYAFSETKPTKPETGSDGTASPWSKTASVVDGLAGYVWMTMCLLSSDGVYGEWSDPTRISGNNVVSITEEQFNSLVEEVVSYIKEHESGQSTWSEEDINSIVDRVVDALNLTQDNDGKVLISWQWDDELEAYLQRMQYLTQEDLSDYVTKDGLSDAIKTTVAYSEIKQSIDSISNLVGQDVVITDLDGNTLSLESLKSYILQEVLANEAITSMSASISEWNTEVSNVKSALSSTTNRVAKTEDGLLAVSEQQAGVISDNYYTLSLLQQTASETQAGASLTTSFSEYEKDSSGNYVYETDESGNVLYDLDADGHAIPYTGIKIQYLDEDGNEVATKDEAADWYKTVRIEDGQEVPDGAIATETDGEYKVPVTDADGNQLKRQRAFKVWYIADSNGDYAGTDNFLTANKLNLNEDGSYVWDSSDSRFISEKSGGREIAYHKKRSVIVSSTSGVITTANANEALAGLFATKEDYDTLKTTVTTISASAGEEGAIAELTARITDAESKATDAYSKANSAQSSVQAITLRIPDSGKIVTSTTLSSQVKDNLDNIISGSDIVTTASAIEAGTNLATYLDGKYAGLNIAVTKDENTGVIESTAKLYADQIDLTADHSLTVKSNGAINVESGGVIDVNSGSINVNSGSINVKSGGNINLRAGGAIRLAAAGGAIVAEAGDCEVKFDNDGILMLNDETSIWKLMSNGSGMIAKGAIKWGEDGSLTLGSDFINAAKAALTVKSLNVDDRILIGSDNSGITIKNGDGKVTSQFNTDGSGSVAGGAIEWSKDGKVTRFSDTMISTINDVVVNAKALILSDGYAGFVGDWDAVNKDKYSIDTISAQADTSDNNDIVLWAGYDSDGAGGDLDMSNFYVTKGGYLCAGNAYIKGTIDATDGTFSGKLKGATGTFTGALTSVGENVSIVINAADTNDEETSLVMYHGSVSNPNSNTVLVKLGLASVVDDGTTYNEGRLSLYTADSYHLARRVTILPLQVLVKGQEYANVIKPGHIRIFNSGDEDDTNSYPHTELSYNHLKFNDAPGATYPFGEYYSNKMYLYQSASAYTTISASAGITTTGSITASGTISGTVGLLKTSNPSSGTLSLPSASANSGRIYFAVASTITSSGGNIYGDGNSHGTSWSLGNTYCIVAISNGTSWYASVY